MYSSTLARVYSNRVVETGQFRNSTLKNGRTLATSIGIHVCKTVLYNNKSIKSKICGLWTARRCEDDP